MEAIIQKKIINRIQGLNSFQLKELLDFVEFLNQKVRTTFPKANTIDEICGKYRNRLSSSSEFSMQKREEIRIER